MNDFSMLSDLRQIDRWISKAKMPMYFKSYVCWRKCDDDRINEQQLLNVFGVMDRVMLETDYAESWEDFWCLLNDSVIEEEIDYARNLMDSYKENLQKAITDGKLQQTVDSIDLLLEFQYYRCFMDDVIFTQPSHEAPNHVFSL